MVIKIVYPAKFATDGQTDRHRQVDNVYFAHATARMIQKMDPKTGRESVCRNDPAQERNREQWEVTQR